MDSIAKTGTWVKQMPVVAELCTAADAPLIDAEILFRQPEPTQE